MGKNILLLAGSPRRGGNSDRLVGAFVRGAEAAGHRCTVYETASKNIRPCQGCGQCWTTENPCVIHDEFDGLFALLKTSQTLVLASPLYWGWVSAQLKIPWDRLHCCAKKEHQKKLGIRESVFILCGHNPGLAQFEAAADIYRDIASYMGWIDRGVLLVPGLLEKDDVEKTDYLSRAEVLGRSM
jgi:multimeric flavodoxin WrbA